MGESVAQMERGVTDQQPRCWRCNHMLALYLSRPWSLKCPKCKSQNQSAPGDAPLSATDLNSLC